MQALDPTGKYSPAAVLDALTGRRGSRTLTYRYDRLDELNKYVEPIDYLIEGTISNNALADIKRTAKFTLLDRGGINYLKDRIRPWVRLAMPDGGYVEWPQGVFLLATPSRTLGANGIVMRDVEAYDQLLVLQDDKVADRYSVAVGAKYTDAVNTLVFGFARSVTPSALTLPGGMEWEPGTTKLRILNDLLGAINYESAWFDERGTLICRPYQAPSTVTPGYVYGADAASVITGDVGQTIDLFDVANKWVLVKSEADQAPLTGTYVNDAPSSPTSTVSRGRVIVDFRTEEDAADQATLTAKAQRLGFNASQVFENIELETAAMPIHSNADVLRLSVPGLAVEGIYSEHTWELRLRAGAPMSHTVRRVVTL